MPIDLGETPSIGIKIRLVEDRLRDLILLVQAGEPGSDEALELICRAYVPFAIHAGARLRRVVTPSLRARLDMDDLVMGAMLGIVATVRRMKTWEEDVVEQAVRRAVWRGQAAVAHQARRFKAYAIGDMDWHPAPEEEPADTETAMRLWTILPAEHRDVLKRWLGLGVGPEQTLEEIGTSEGITKAGAHWRKQGAMKALRDASKSG